MAESIEAAPLSVSIRFDGEQPSLAVSGQVHDGNFVELGSALDKLAEEIAECVSLDLAAVEKIEPTALRCFVESANAYRMRQRRLRLASASIPAMAVLDELPLSDLFCVEQECENGSCRRRLTTTDDNFELDTFTLPCQAEHCREARARVDRVAEAVGFCERGREDVRLAVGEAAANAIKHGGSGDGEGCFSVVCVGTPEKLSVWVSDNGSGFSPDELARIDETHLCEFGRGVHCIKAVMDEVDYAFDSGTTVRMVKHAAESR
jgi:anti-sigma regulatory factor (Ser/Thr protein kinase)